MHHLLQFTGVDGQAIMVNMYDIIWTKAAPTEGQTNIAVRHPEYTALLTVNETPNRVASYLVWAQSKIENPAPVQAQEDPK